MLCQFMERLSNVGQFMYAGSRCFFFSELILTWPISTLQAQGGKPLGIGQCIQNVVNSRLLVSLVAFLRDVNLTSCGAQDLLKPADLPQWIISPYLHILS